MQDIKNNDNNDNKEAKHAVAYMAAKTVFCSVPPYRAEEVYAEGDVVVAQYDNTPVWYRGTVSKSDPVQRAYIVAFPDGDKEGFPHSRLRRPVPFLVGMRVGVLFPQALYRNKKEPCARCIPVLGVVTRVVEHKIDEKGAGGDVTYSVHTDDGLLEEGLHEHQLLPCSLGVNDRAVKSRWALGTRVELDVAKGINGVCLGWISNVSAIPQQETVLYQISCVDGSLHLVLEQNFRVFPYKDEDVVFLSSAPGANKEWSMGRVVRCVRDCRDFGGFLYTVRDASGKEHVYVPHPNIRSLSDVLAARNIPALYFPKEDGKTRALSVTLTGNAAHGSVLLTVKDTGVQIPFELVPSNAQPLAFGFRDIADEELRLICSRLDKGKDKKSEGPELPPQMRVVLEQGNLRELQHLLHMLAHHHANAHSGKKDSDDDDE